MRIAQGGEEGVLGAAEFAEAVERGQGVEAGEGLRRAEGGGLERGECGEPVQVAVDPG